MTTQTNQNQKKKINPKSKRPEHIVPMHAQRDQLSVEGIGPEWECYWFLDKSDQGHEIRSAMRAGWSFVEATEIESVGDDYVFDSEFGGGNIIRKPGNPKTTGEFLYLMKIPKKWAEQGRKEQQKLVDATEQTMMTTGSPDGKGVEELTAIKGHKAGINIKR